MRFLRLLAGLVLAGSVLYACSAEQPTAPASAPVLSKDTTLYQTQADSAFCRDSGGTMGSGGRC